MATEPTYTRLLETNMVKNKSFEVADFKEFAKVLNSDRPRTVSQRVRAATLREVYAFKSDLLDAMVTEKMYDDVLLVDPKKFIQLLGLEKKVFVNWNTKKKRYNVSVFKEKPVQEPTQENKA